MERLIEYLALVAPRDEHGVQRPVEILAIVEPDGAHRAQRFQHLARPDGKACAPQNAGEMHDVLGEPPAPAGRRVGQFAVVRVVHRLPPTLSLPLKGGGDAKHHIPLPLRGELYT